MEAMFQLRIDTVTGLKEISQISVVNNYSKAPDSGEAREVHLSSHVAASLLFNSLTYWKAVWEGKADTVYIPNWDDKKANHEFPDKIGEERVVLPIKAFIGSILKYWSYDLI